MDWTLITALVALSSDWIIRLAMLFIVPRRRAPTAAQAWLMFIFMIPWIGLAIYLLIGSPKLTRRRRDLQREVDDMLAEAVTKAEQDAELAPLFRHRIDPQYQQIASLAQHLGGLPVFSGNSAELLADYNGALERIVADIDAASHHVHLMFYIFADDAAGQRVIDALGRAAERGITCRVLVDALGSHKYRSRLFSKLRALGVEAYQVLPVSLFDNEFSRADLRNHRKIVVIDGFIGYTGSQNIVNADFKPGITYEEIVVRMSGPIVSQLQAVFLADWYSETRTLLAQPDAIERNIPLRRGGGLAAQVLPSGPAYDTENNLLLFNELLYAARHRAVITTPYFVPEESLLRAMESAARRGVELHVIVSGIADQFMVSRAQRSYYEELLEAGVHIHILNPPVLLHAKTISIDDAVAVVGSSNMDVRSFRLNLEITAVFYDKALNHDLQRIEQEYFARSVELSLEEWCRRPFTQQLFENSLRLVSALL